MATAARTTIAEVEELVEPGAIDPDHVVTPGIYVRHIVKGERYENRIEKRTTRNSMSRHEDEDREPQVVKSQRSRTRTSRNLLVVRLVFVTVTRRDERALRFR